MKTVQIIHSLPKAAIGWIDFSEFHNALYIGKPEDALYEEITAHIAKTDCFMPSLGQQPEDTYDLIVCSQVFEACLQAADMLAQLGTHLSETGRLFLLMHNRLGIRYFCGDRDPYTERNFDGIENYRRAYNKAEDHFKGKAYSKEEMRDILMDCGIEKDHMKFYSIYPGLENPAFLFAEGYVPNEDLSNRIQPIYYYPGSVFLEEEALYNSLVKNQLFHTMANAYLVEITKRNAPLPVEHVTSSLERGEEDALYTIITSDQRVIKRSAYPEGNVRLSQLHTHLQQLKERGLEVVEGKLLKTGDGTCYEMPYIDAPTGQLYLRRTAEKDIRSFLKAMDHFRDLIMRSSEEASTDEVEAWKDRYRAECEEQRRAQAERDGREYKPREIQDDFFDFDLGPVLKNGFIDLVPLNSFYLDGEFWFYDQEFCLDVYPAKAILYRMVITLYSRSLEMNKYIKLDELLGRYGLFQDQGKWSALQSHWLDPLLNYRELYSYHKAIYRAPDIVNSNRQRMNYSQEEYQRIFVNLFENADTRKLILFGSGVYARKFLKLYGEDYPVSFVIDNSESRWGQSFEGLEIRSPEALRKFSPGEYKVIVCIKNYPSVIRQLNEMGVTCYSIYDAGMSYQKPHRPTAVTESEERGQPKKYHVGYVAGVFDLFHIGHLNIFKRAKEYCDYLIVGVVTDEGVRQNKKADPVIPFAERIEMVRSCRYVDEAVEIPNGFHDTIEAYKLYHFDVQLSGSDYEHDRGWLEKQQYLREHGADLVFFPYTQSTSSTKLKCVINDRLEDRRKREEEKLPAIEKEERNRKEDFKIVAGIGGVCGNLRPKQGVGDLRKAGFKSAVMDFAKFTKISELESIGKPNRKAAKDLPDIAMEPWKLSVLAVPFIEACKNNKLELPVAYAPYLFRNTEHTDLNERIEELAVESIRLCAQSGSRYIVIRQLFAGIPYGEEWAVNQAFYLRLAPVARENNVMILLENQCKDVGGHLVRGVCTDGVRAAKWVDDLNEAAGEERFGFCMDIGACNVCGMNMYDFAVDLGKRIKVVIIKENNGDAESNILPFTQLAQTDYLSLLRGLRKIAYDGIVLMDFSSTASASSPIIRPEIIHFAKTVGDYFKWQIDIENLIRRYPKRVLFGAGNMCRNYMKCYGEDFPPLFTCDNNQKLWGSDFCGLEVKPPEALKELPVDCVIFICNVYYREIQQQLRDMGVKNPIEFFNDEYMPSFYFNRLEDAKS